MAAQIPDARPPRSEAQRQASRVNGARSRGPTTQEGKWVASKNALKHGAFARRLLLPGDSEEEYESNLENWITTLAPSSPALVDLVHRVADVVFRQERLRRQEDAVLTAQIEAKTAQTEAAGKLGAAQNALAAVQGLILLAEGVGTAMPPSRVQPLLPAMAKVVDIAAAGSAPLPLVRALAVAVEELTISTIIEVSPASFGAVATACHAVERALQELLPDLQRQVDQERERVSRGLLFGDSKEVRNLERTRARLARELDQEMAAFRAARDLVAGAEHSERSGEAATERLVGEAKLRSWPGGPRPGV